MTSVEVAEHLRVPLETLYAWRARGTAPRGVRVGRHTHYRPEDVEAWIEARADAEAAA
ncbi:helix-turn-helix domain-containing protein [Phytohabitans sp. ZYX-F-186]|uniref:Helix-turn-helix domain-containing protein n=1 Tax=Phytohabitans maris TaxID=3071409 RepID=A0ABU0ZUQ9_9ACTN|nr:helix-turn-helix domain-containing protein [Phytohabitans sp. ZYX-F-186]MDQ7910774.1 helix-turn-helix domain-containing protein [Phytohabitans sp. ZYX-F-186]